jgi:DNA topoisomerase-3
MYDELYIAEKPSLGRAIAEGLVALSKRPGNEKGDPIIGVKGERGDSHLIVGNKVVSWYVGHMYEQADPEEYDPIFAGGFRKGKDALPVIPKVWKIKPVKRTQGQLKVVNELIGQSKVIVNAGDPDDEGQLLIDEGLHYIGNKKPTKRLLLNAVDAASVVKALQSMRDNEEFLPTYHAALCRSRADWLLGMNGTRAATLANRMGDLLTIGRVQTPTLALVVKRYLEIKNFKPQTYYLPTPEFAHKKGSYKGKWVAPQGFAGLDSEGRLSDPAMAKKIASDVTGQPGAVIEYDVREQKESQPMPFSLSALQMKASKQFGLTAAQTLSIAQSLYETHKIASYPRTDSGFLKESQFGEAPGVIAAISRFDPAIATLAKSANLSIRSKAWNDKKVDAHHGIIPTAAPNYNSLTPNERKVFGLIVKQYLAQFFPEYVYNQTTVLTKCGGHTFKSTGRTPVDFGWKKVFGAEDDDSSTSKKKEGEEDQNLPLMDKGDTVLCTKVNAEKKETKPPKAYTEATLLAAMQNIADTVEDPEMKKKLREVKGIGTPATQSATLERLKELRFMYVEKSSLVPTEGAVAYIQGLPRELTDPVMTAMWQMQMDRVKAKQLTLQEFMDGQVKWITQLTKKTLETPITISLQKKVVAGGVGSKCPKCQEAGRDGVLRQLMAKNGPNAGKPFLGCTNYPECKHAQNISSDKAGGAGQKTASAKGATGAKTTSTGRR